MVCPVLMYGMGESAAPAGVAELREEWVQQGESGCCFAGREPVEK